MNIPRPLSSCPAHAPHKPTAQRERRLVSASNGKRSRADVPAAQAASPSVPPPAQMHGSHARCQPATNMRRHKNKEKKLLRHAFILIRPSSITDSIPYPAAKCKYYKVINKLFFDKLLLSYAAASTPPPHKLLPRRPPDRPIRNIRTRSHLAVIDHVPKSERSLALYDRPSGSRETASPFYSSVRIIA